MFTKLYKLLYKKKLKFKPYKIEFNHFEKNLLTRNSDIEAIEFFSRLSKKTSYYKKQVQLSLYYFESDKENYEKLIRIKTNRLSAYINIAFSLLRVFPKVIKGFFIIKWAK